MRVDSQCGEPSRPPALGGVCHTPAVNTSKLGPECNGGRSVSHRDGSKFHKKSEPLQKVFAQWIR